MVPNPRMAGYYAVVCLLLLLVVRFGWPWSAIALWPALAMAVIICGYLGVGPSIYGKKNGVLPLRTRVFFAPTLFGQYLSLLYYRRQCHPWDKVVPGVCIGRLLSESESEALMEEGVTAVLDLTSEFSEPAALRAVAYRNLPILDLTAPTQSDLRGVVDFMRSRIEAGDTVYVHCKVGYSRTATVVGAYLMDVGQCETVEDAVETLRAARPGIVVRPEALEALKRFHARN